jgi:23S rRNA pseudouridine2605 synthase
MLRDQLGERIAALAGADFAGPVTQRGDATEVSDRHSGAPRSSEPKIHERRRSEFSKTADRDSGPRAKARDRNDKEFRKAQPKPEPKPKRITRNDTIADRRGRSIPVTRVHTEKPQRVAPGKHRGKPHRPDRSRGPRPYRPR